MQQPGVTITGTELGLPTTTQYRTSIQPSILVPLDSLCMVGHRFER